MNDKEIDLKLTKLELNVLADIVEKELDRVIAENQSKMSHNEMEAQQEHQDVLDLLLDKIKTYRNDMGGGKRKRSSRRTHKNRKGSRKH